MLSRKDLIKVYGYCRIKHSCTYRPKKTYSPKQERPMREKLVSLIQDSVGGCARNWAEVIADYLLANGVIVVDTAAVSVENRPLISQCLGRPLDEIIELVQAKEDGRVIVPPCKVGDTVYYISGFGGYEKIGGKEVKRILFDDEGVYITVRGKYMDYTIPENELYITREEAEKELERRTKG